MTIDTEHLKSLLERVAPGEWVTFPAKVRWHGSEPLFADGTWHIVSRGSPESISLFETQQGDDHDEATRLQAEYNAKLSALAPTLARRVIAAEKLAEALRYARRFLRPCDHDTDYLDNILTEWDKSQ